MKNFDEWNDVKKSIDSKDINRDLFYHAREVWWCSLGQNVGAEADGKNEFFERPVLIIKKFNSEMVLAIPMTSKEKIGKYFLKVSHDKGDSYANLSQLKVISTKRLQRKIGMINEGDFNLVIKEIVAYLETSNPPFGGFWEAEATNIYSISDQNLLSNKIDNIKHYNKLVRDNMIDVWNSEKGTIASDIKYKYLDKEEILEKLKDKIYEEVQEVISAYDEADKTHLKEELGDLIEVIDAILYHNNIGLEEVLKMRDAKKEKKGGFQKGLYLEYINYINKEDIK